MVVYAMIECETGSRKKLDDGVIEKVLKIMGIVQSSIKIDGLNKGLQPSPSNKDSAQVWVGHLVKHRWADIQIGGLATSTWWCQ